MGEISSVEDRFRLEYVRPVAGKTLIIGSKIQHAGREDVRKRFHHAVGIDIEEGEGVDLIFNLERAPTEERWKHVECCSVLEHCRNPWKLAKNAVLSLEFGGSIYVHAPTVWRFHCYPNDYWRFTSEGIKLLFEGIRWEALMYGDFEGKLTDGPAIPHQGGWYNRMQIFGFGHRV